MPLEGYWTSVLKVACEGRFVPTEAELARKESRSYESGEQLLREFSKNAVKNGMAKANTKSREFSKQAQLVNYRKAGLGQHGTKLPFRKMVDPSRAQNISVAPSNYFDQGICTSTARLFGQAIVRDMCRGTVLTRIET